MAEAWAVLSIACSIFQVISTAHEAISISKKLYRDGTADRSLDETASQMQTTLESLLTSISKMPQPRTKDEAELLDIATECCDASRKLAAETNKLKVSDGQRQGKGKVRLGSLGKLYIKRAWKKSELEGLERDFQRHQTVMETRLLLRICTRSDAIALLQKQDHQSIQNIDQRLHNFTKQVAQGYTRMPDLLAKNTAEVKAHVSEEHGKTRLENCSQHDRTRDVLVSDGKQTREVILDGINQIQDTAACDRLLNSLDFPGRNERLNGISEAHSDSFGWLFGNFENPKVTVVDQSLVGYISNPGANTGPVGQADGEDWVLENLIDETQKLTWDSFSNWLISDQKLYWISGKPGAGKSTLMKFLYSNPQTTQLLDMKSNENTLLLWYSFYALGTIMQNNIKGLLCSLIYQIIEQYSAETTATLFQLHPSLQKKKEVGDWSERELQDALSENLQRASGQKLICVFLDGLDEINSRDGVHKLLLLLEDLRIHAPLTVKLCLSSRPEEAFRQSFGSYPHIELHFLTAPDVYRYALELVESAFSRSQTPFDMPKRSSFSARRRKYFWLSDTQVLAKTIVSKSQGVFLWAHLPMKSLKYASTNRDTYAFIQKRLDELPDELGELYSSMWKRLNADTKLYRAQAALIFHMLIAGKHLFRFEYTYLGAPRPDRHIQRYFSLGHLALAWNIVKAFTPDDISETNMEDAVAPNRVANTCSLLCQIIPIRCAGFVEISQGVYQTMPDLSEASLCPDFELNFIHRTAKDFLIGTNEGRDILAFDTSSEEARICAIMHAWLSRSKVFRMHKASEDWALQCHDSSIHPKTVIWNLQAVQTCLSRATWLKWIGFWESYIFNQLDDRHFRKGATTYEVLEEAVCCNMTDFVAMSCHRAYSSEYKNFLLRISAKHGSYRLYLNGAYWFDMLDLLLSQGAKDKHGHIEHYTPRDVSAFESFIWGVRFRAAKMPPLKDEEAGFRALKTLRNFLMSGVQPMKPVYCFCDSSLDLYPWITSRGHGILLEWTIYDILVYKVRSRQTEIRQEFIECVERYDKTIIRTPPEILAIFKTDDIYNFYWYRTGKRSNAVIQQRISEFLWEFSTTESGAYNHEVMQRDRNFDTTIAELLADGDGPEDIRNFLVEELYLDDTRLASLAGIVPVCLNEVQDARSVRFVSDVEGY